MKQRTRRIRIEQPVQVLELQPDDVLVIQVPGFLTQDEVNLLREEAAQAFPDRKTIVMDGGMTLKTAIRERDAA